MVTLENEFLHFALSPETASWSIASQRPGQLMIEGARLGMSYRQENVQHRALEQWEPLQITRPEEVTSMHGPLYQIDLICGPDAQGLQFHISFALPYRRPFLLWRIVVANRSALPIYVDRLDLLRMDTRQSSKSGVPSLISGSQSPIASPAFFSNGWGSWNSTGVYGMNESFRTTRLGFLHAPMRVNAGTPQPHDSGHFASDMFGVLGDRANRVALLSGFLSQHEHFGSLEAWLHTPHPLLYLWANGDGARLDPGSTLTTDWASLFFLDIDGPDPLGPYLEAVARQNDVPLNLLRSGPHELPTNPSALLGERSSGNAFHINSPTGWCSWYQYFDKVSAQDIRSNLQAASALRPNLPLDVIQIDDGFESTVGDWFSFSPSFPDGVAPLASEIRTAGFTPGLWLAPFIIDPSSQLARQHPEWLLRSRFNRPVNAGYVWNRLNTALDLTRPEALDYASEVVQTAVHTWGFPYLKLDFLYAAALPGNYYDPTRTRAQALRHGLQALRLAAGPQTFLLGCGCPLGPAIGLVDAMRIGADVAPDWEPTRNGVKFFFRSEPDYPSARNAVQNVLTRSALHRRWWANDPDCLLLRPDTNLTIDEVQSLAVAASLTDGLIFVSDNLEKLPPDRLRLAQMLLPPLGRVPHIFDWFDATTPRHLRLDLRGAAGSWYLLALFNWEDKPQNLTLRLADYDLEVGGDYLAHEFWSGKTYRLQNGALPFNVPAHGNILLAVRRRSPVQPQYLGSNLHISQGQEVSLWEWQSRGELKAGLERPGRCEGRVALYLPAAPLKAALNGVSVHWESCGENCYLFPVAFEKRGLLVVNTAAA